MLKTLLKYLPEKKAEALLKEIEVHYIPDRTFFDQVKTFTEACSEAPLPQTPKLMTREEWTFLKDMIKDEMDEVDQAFEEYEADPTASSEALLVEQADFCIDAPYYIFDAASKAGIDLNPIFNIVQGANMKKVGSDGKVTRREDGKVLKPSDWVDPMPVIKDELNRQSRPSLSVSDFDFDPTLSMAELQKQIRANI